MNCGRLQSSAILAGVLTLVSFAVAQSKVGDDHGSAMAERRPNILWITIDDCGPDFGVYGNSLVTTPHLDQLATEGQRFTRCFASTPVCSPVRSAMITGCQALTIGSHQHRSDRALPAAVRPLTELLSERGWRPSFLPHKRMSPKDFARTNGRREEGFGVVSGSNKQDFNFSRGQRPLFEAWDPNRKQTPFFALIDFHAPKVGQGTGRAHQWAQQAGRIVDPAQLELPPYWFDTPSVRRAFARYHEGISLLDAEIGSLLHWLGQEGLRDNTLIFIVGDHGVAMLRHKQWCYDGGLHVPLIVNGPGLKPAVRSELVSTIDLAAATLSVCGIAQPEWMEGRDFLGARARPRERIFASRDRCDETEDRVRAMRTDAWKLIHNLRPDESWIGRNAYTRRTFPNVALYLEQDPSERTEVQAAWASSRKPQWELYDLRADPLELRNLANSEAHRDRLQDLQVELLAWEARVDGRNPYPESLATITPPKAREAVVSQRKLALERGRPPNVILILADDLGYGELGCYGQARIRTPRIDALASQGVRFTQAYSGHTVCAPSRCVLLTGKHTGQAQIRANSPWASARNPMGEGQEPLLPQTPTIARSLQARDYATACIGKWGLGGPETSGHPNRQGFDLFFGYLCQKQAHDYYPAHLWRNEERIVLDNPGFTPRAKWQEAPLDESAYAAFSGRNYAPDSMLAEAEAWIRSHSESPFFLYYATPVPHAALQVPKDSLQAYRGLGWDEKPYLGQKGYLPHPAPRAAYAAMVSRLDRDVGHLVDLIAELGLHGDTLFLFTSDNGPTFNGGTDSNFFESTHGLRGRKGSLHEGGIRIPLIARWHGVLPQGVTTETPVGFQDAFPTLLELAGAAQPQDLDGVSILRSLLGEHEDRSRPPLYWETKQSQAIRVQDWKLIRSRDAKRGTERVELYDLAADPAESNDRSADEPERVQQLLRQIEVARRPSTRFASAFDPEPDEDKQ